MGRKQVCAIFIIVIFILPVLSSFIQIPDQKRQMILKNDPGNLAIRSDPPLVLWNKTWGGPSTKGNGVAVDANGSVYYVGSRGDNLMLVKFFSNGTMAWEYIHPPSSAGYGVAVDNDGSIYCVGTDNSAPSSMLLVKFLSNGTQVWARIVPGGMMGATAGFGMAVDNKGSIYCAGLKTQPFPPSTSSLLVKFFSNGTKVWECTFETGVPFTSVAVDSAGFVYSIASSSGTPSSSLFKIHPISRSTVWQRSLPFVTSGITVDSNGSSYCVGYTEYFYSGTEDLCLTKFFSNGTKAWDTNWSTSNIDQGVGVAVDAKGVIYCVGNTLGYSPTTNLALIAFFPNGTKSWQFIGNSSIENYGNGVALNANGSIFCAGYIGTEFLLLKLGRTIPTAPQNLQAIAGNNQINLTWQAPLSDGASDITNYKIYQGVVSGGESYRATVGDILNFTDTGLINGMAYYYKVRAVNGIGEGPFSNEIFVIPGPVNGLSLLWNKTWGGPTYGAAAWDGIGNLVAIDSNGSVYCVGTNSTGDPDHLMLTKFFSNGTKVWENINSILGEGHGVTVDKEGCIYCAGKDGGRNFMLVKFFSNGTIAWKSTYNVGSFERGVFHGVAVDNEGSIYCVGTLYFGIYEYATYLVKFFSNGTIAWQLGRSGRGFGVAVDSAGFIYVASESYLLKVSSNKTVIWEQATGGPLGYFAANGVTVDNNGYIYYVGYLPESPSGNSGLILRKLSSNGTKVWETLSFGSNVSICGKGVAIDGNGAIYCVGYVYSSGKYNLALFRFFSNGTNAWQMIWNDPKQSTGDGVALDSQAAIYCIGYTYSASTFSADFLLLKYAEADLNFPSTTILEPSNGASLSGAKIWINGTISAGTNHTIQQVLINDVRFTNTTTLIGENSGNFAFYNTSYIPDGTLWINVTGVNEVGQKGTGIVLFTLDNTPPGTANITCPVGGSWVKGTIWINATAADATSGIKNISFYRDASTLLGTTTMAPYSLKWNTLLTSDGDHILSIRAFDRAGNYLDSNNVTIPVDNTPPVSVSILTPAPGNYVKFPCVIRVIGWDQAAWLKNITLYRDAGILIGAAGQSIWGYLGQWNTTGLDGVHTLYARAFDQAGNYLDSSTVTVIVDNTPPNAAVVTSPVAGTYVKGTIWINATATDAMGLRNVTFYRDDVVLIGTDTTAPYAIQWNTTGLDGAHTLYIRAFDRTGFYDFQIMHAIWINGTPYPPYIYAGNYLDSAPIAIIIDNTAPTSAMVTAPAPGAYVHGTIWINATATDAIGIKNVTFYRDAGILLGTASTAPYGIQCLTGSYGVHTLYVRAFDNAGNYWDSMNIPVTVITMPTIPRNLRVNPGNGQVYLTWLVPASDGGSAITNYKIYRSTSSGNETYLVTLINVSSFRDTNLVNGWTYYYRVSAVNEAGESLWSSEVSCMVNISVDGIQKFGWLIIIFLVAGLVGLSGGILYFNRRTTSTAGKTLRSLKAPIGQKGLKFGKYLSAEVFEKEDSIQLEVGPQSLWKSLMLRFNRLYKSEKWAQALALLGPLKEIAEYLHDGEKIKALSAKYDELKVKRQQNSYAN